MQIKELTSDLNDIEGIEVIEPIPSLCEPLLSDAQLLLEGAKAIGKTRDILLHKATTKQGERIKAVKLTLWANCLAVHIIDNGTNEIYTRTDCKELKLH